MDKDILKSKFMDTFEEYNEFDLALGLYHWLQHNWHGQSDPLYAAFCELTRPGMYRPSRSDELFENIDDSAKEVYGQLTLKNYESVLGGVLNYKPE
jgi:hypothetical protein